MDENELEESWLPKAGNKKQFLIAPYSHTEKRKIFSGRKDLYVLYFLNGNCWLEYPDKVIRVDSPALFLSCPQEQGAFLRSGNEPGRDVYCLFNRAFLEKEEGGLWQDLNKDLVKFPDQRMLFMMENYFCRMQKEFNSKYVYKFDLLQNYLSLLLHEMVRNNIQDNYSLCHAGKDGEYHIISYQ